MMSEDRVKRVAEAIRAHFSIMSPSEELARAAMAAILTPDEIHAIEITLEYADADDGYSTTYRDTVRALLKDLQGEKA